MGLVFKLGKSVPESVLLMEIMPQMVSTMDTINMKDTRYSFEKIE